MRTEVFTAVSANITAFWDVTPCRLVEDYWCFRGLAVSVFKVEEKEREGWKISKICVNSYHPIWHPRRVLSSSQHSTLKLGHLRVSCFGFCIHIFQEYLSGCHFLLFDGISESLLGTRKSLSDVLRPVISICINFSSKDSNLWLRRVYPASYHKNIVTCLE